MARKSRKNSVLETPGAIASGVIWNTALYARESVENERKREADTIGTQMQMLEDYVSEHSDMVAVDIYCDDDISGTDFLRPEFARMMNDVRQGRINCIIVKDLSRLGRNLIEAGEYIEMVFPFLNVRFISINDGFDTKYNAPDLSVQIKNMANELYAKDISLKIQSTMKNLQQQGKFVGSKAPYGYLRDPKDKHRFVIDPEAAPIVKELFEMISEGNTLHYAATTMNSRGVPSPGRHNYDLGLVQSAKFRDSKWYSQTVRKILLDPVYMGWLVTGRYRSSFLENGQHKQIATPPEDWVITKGAHEPIVTKVLFDKAQSYFEETKKALGFATKYDCASKRKSMLKGKLRCGECGKAMFLRKKKHGDKEQWWYYCPLHETYGKSYCSKKAIKHEDLNSVLFRAVQKQVQLFTDACLLLKTLNRKEHGKTKSRIYAQQINEIKKQISRYTNLKASLYEDFAEGVISEADYVTMGQTYAQKADELKIFLAELQKESQKYSPDYDGGPNWSKLIETFQEKEQLDQTLVDAFIDSVTVYNDSHYEIVFRFKDEYEAAVNMAAARRIEGERYAG